MRDDRSRESDASARSDRTNRRIELWLQVLENAAIDVSSPELRFDALNDLLDAIGFFARPEIAPVLAELGVDDSYDALRRMVESWNPDQGPDREDEAFLPTLVARLALRVREMIAHHH